MATLSTIDTYNDVLTKAAYKVGETTVDTGAQRQAWLKDAIQDIFGRRRWSWALTTASPQTIVNGTATYTLPTDYYEDATYQVKLTDTASPANDYFYSPIFEWQLANMSQPTLTSSPYYYVRGNRADGYTITILPTPTSTQAGWSLNVKYTKLVTDYAALTDKVPMPDTTALVMGIVKEIFRSQNRLDQFEIARQEYEASIDELSNTDLELERALNLSIIDYRDYVGIPRDIENFYGG